MKKSTASSFFVATAILTGTVGFAASQNAGMGMDMATHTLLVAQLDAKQVVGGSSSQATGTGAFLLDPAQHTMEYSLTYQGLESGGAKSIALHNFGKGKNGAVIDVLCGEGAQPCPSSSSATISGNVRPDRGRQLDNALIGEFDSGRVYVEVVGNSGRSEIRGQLGFNGAMVKVANYIAHLAPAAGVDSKGSGTAIVSETYLPGGKTSVFYAGTAAATSSAPVGVAFTGGVAPAAKAFTPRLALPQLKLNVSRDTQSGGSFFGSYEVSGTATNALLVSRLKGATDLESGIVVATSRFPQGELYGALVPVR